MAWQETEVEKNLRTLGKKKCHGSRWRSVDACLKVS
jgi:hypothetical protein